MAGLAVCRYPDDKGFYLFGCDSEWQCVMDTWHQTLEEAQHQAEFEYEGVTKTWVFTEPSTPTTKEAPPQEGGPRPN